MCLTRSCGDNLSQQRHDLLTVEDWSGSCCSPLFLSLEHHFHELELDGSELFFLSFVALDSKQHRLTSGCS